MQEHRESGSQKVTNLTHSQIWPIDTHNRKVLKKFLSLQGDVMILPHSRPPIPLSGIWVVGDW